MDTYYKVLNINISIINIESEKSEADKFNYYYLNFIIINN